MNKKIMHQLQKKIQGLTLLLLCSMGAMAQAEFITTWNTENSGTSNNNSIIIPAIGRYDVDIGNDGSYELLDQTGTITIDITTHGYLGGEIQIAMRNAISGAGNLERILLGIGSTDAEKIISIDQWGSSIAWTSMESAYAGCINLDVLATDTPNLSIATDLNRMFFGCSSMVGSLVFNSWDVSNVTIMANMFNTTLFNQPLNNWDVSSVTTMLTMFERTPFNQPLNTWDVSNVTNMRGMFFKNTAFNQPIDTWDVSSVTNMLAMFQETPFNQPLNNWDVSNVTFMQGMFQETPFNQPLNNWDVSSVTNMRAMFFKNTVFNQPLNTWDVSSVTSMLAMFQGTPFNQPLNTWDVSSVTNMRVMFLGTPFNQPLNNWDVSSVTNMESMFAFSSFNQPIDTWDVSNVTGMGNMFRDSEFNQPISTWDVSNVTDMQLMFTNSPFNQPIGNWDVSSVTNTAGMFSSTIFNQPIGNWDVSNVTNMRIMFSGNTAFNQPIGTWDVSSVTNMESMFAFSSFNQPIGNWDVSNVTNIAGMFNQNSAFNQPIGNWDVSNVTNMLAMFYSASAFNQDLGSWDLGNVTDARYFLDFSGLSIANWDATLTGWHAQNFSNSNVTVGADGLQFCNALVQRDAMQTAGIFTFVNDVLNCSTPIITCNPISDNYQEAVANNGSIATNANPLIYTIVNDSFIDRNDDDILDDGFTISNLPVGLTAQFELSNNDTVATLILNGNATNNNSADSVAALNVSFTSAAVTSITPTVNCATATGIDFQDSLNIDARLRHGKLFLNGKEQPMVTGRNTN